MSAVGDNVFRAVTRGPDLRVQSEPVLRDDAIDVVFGMIDVTNIRHDAADDPSIREAADRRRMHDAQICVAEKVTAAPQAVDHSGSVDVRRIDVPVNVDFYRCVHGDDKQPGDYLGIVGKPHRTENNFFAASLEKAQEFVSAGFRKRYRRRRCAFEFVVVFDLAHHAVLEYLGPESDFLEGGPVEFADDGIGYVPDA